jgi:uncharacterized protein YbaR (Trm112 family)
MAIKLALSLERITRGYVKRELVEILACPLCKGTLELKVAEEDEEEVTEGSLHCSRCNEVYPIKDTIPNLLPPDLRD